MNFAFKTFTVAMALSLSLVTSIAFAQKAPVAGTIGITKEESTILAKGWSIKKDIMGMDVYNDASEKVGVIEDIIVTPDKAMSYAVVSTGGYLGMGKNDVVIPVNHFKITNKRILLPGATKEAVKSMPPFKYAD